jgi:hypothetical protein
MMRNTLVIQVLLACAVAALIINDGWKVRRISVGHVGVFLFASLAIFTAPAAWDYNFGWHGRGTSPRNACINNLRQIDGAKEQWAIENHIQSGAPSIPKEVNAYMKGGGPKCPEGGTYTYGKVDEPPRCSIKGHSL